MVSRLLFLLAAAALLAGCAIGGDGDDESVLERTQFVVPFIDLQSQAEDEAVGGVGLTGRGSRTAVTIDVDDPRGPVLQADVRLGNCADVMSQGVVYKLQPVEDGTSETVVDLPLREFRRLGYMVMVHHPGAVSTTQGLCADLTKARSPDAAPVYD